MGKFNYTVRDKEARLITGILEAKDAFAAARELKEKELTVIAIEKAEAREDQPAAKRSYGGSKKVKPMELVMFSRQLATLIDSGVSLIMSLNILHDQVEGVYLKSVIDKLRSDIEAGNSLSDAFTKHPEAFPDIFANMVRAGETSGSLNDILERVADYMERSENLRRTIKSALTYPILVISIAMLIVAFLMIKVVPAFKGIFESMGGELPAPTQILIDVSDKFKRFWWLGLGIIGGIVFLFKQFVNSEKGRIIFDSFLLKLPMFGVIINKIVISRFAQTLETLVKSSVGILEAIEIAGKVSGNKVIEMATQQIKIDVRSGESISEPMEQTKKFPPFVTKMIAVGEQTGELDKMLLKISQYYDAQVKDALGGLTSMIEPLIIIFLGVTIGFIVLAMFMPIFKLTEMMG